MGYRKIPNLYNNTDILMFRECYALEKLHGTSSHVKWNDGELTFYAGGCKHTTFVSLFDEEKLKELFLELGHDRVAVYGEQYGGKQQGMSLTYGKEPKFAAFEVKIEDTWLNVPNADDVTQKLGLEFVYYAKIKTDPEAIDAERDADSEQAIRNGVGPGKKREGVVLRPLIEFRDNRGNRVMAKHKRDEFRETATPRKVGDPKQKLEGEKASLEWVTDMRMRHVVDKMFAEVGKLGPEQTGTVIKAMLDDIEKEGGGEVIMNKATRRAVSKSAAQLYRKMMPELFKQYVLD